MSRPRQAVILAGGLGTRLGALTHRTPKPMLPVKGRPFLDHLIANLARFGIDRVTLLAGYRAEVIEAHYTGPVATPAGPVAVTVRREEMPLGTGGALHMADLEDSFLLLNGDTFFDAPLARLLARPLGPGETARLALREVPDAARYGRVALAGGRIPRFEAPGPGPALINGGIYLMSRRILRTIPAGRMVSLEAEVFPALAACGALGGEALPGAFIDIGVPEDYAAAEGRALLDKPAVFFDRDGTLNVDHGYTHRPGDLVWTEGALEAIRRANARGFYVFVVTNQAGVARGYYAEADVAAFHAEMRAQAAAQAAQIDDFRHCPHHPEGTVRALARACDCRKPAPGMLRELMARWPVRARGSLMIGDRDSDLAAGRAAGIAARLHSGGSLAELVPDPDAPAEVPA